LGLYGINVKQEHYTNKPSKLGFSVIPLTCISCNRHYVKI